MYRFNPEIHHRRSIRLKGHDYSQTGAYFVTVCSRSRECLFGDVVDGKMILNDAGRMVRDVWEELPKYYPRVDIDAFVIMPNHVHAIIVLTDGMVGAGPRARPDPMTLTGQPQGVAPMLSLPDVVHRFKSLATARFRHGILKLSCPPFNKRLWQRNYYEHIIRNDHDLFNIRQYIDSNPAKWEEDENHPGNF